MLHPSMVNIKVHRRPVIVYRPIQPSDLEILERTHGELFPIRYESEFFQNVVNGQDIVSWGAVDQSRLNEQSDELIGFVTVRIIPSKDSEVYKILQYVESYQKENKLKPLPILLCGDWNGSKRGRIYKFLRSQGFVSSYDTAHQYADADTHKWVSHRNHRGNICGVDFIWLLNPNRYRKLLNASWSEAMLGMFKVQYQLKRASLTEEDAFAFLKADNDCDCITYAGFCEALRQLNLIGHCNGLSDEERQGLWVQTDMDGNGFIDYKEFKQWIWSTSWFEQGVEENDMDAFATDAERARQDCCPLPHRGRELRGCGQKTTLFLTMLDSQWCSRLSECLAPD